MGPDRFLLRTFTAEEVMEVIGFFLALTPDEFRFIRRGLMNPQETRREIADPGFSRRKKVKIFRRKKREYPAMIEILRVFESKQTRKMITR